MVYDYLPHEIREPATRAHYALHTLWTKAVGTRKYDKRDWKALDKAISDLISTRCLCGAARASRLAQAAQRQKIGTEGEWEALLQAIKDLVIR
jgi:hypothetical protein